jgi:hypothetical protein
VPALVAAKSCASQQERTEPWPPVPAPAAYMLLLARHSPSPSLPSNVLGHRWERRANGGAQPSAAPPLSCAALVVAITTCGMLHMPRVPAGGSPSPAVGPCVDASPRYAGLGVGATTEGARSSPARAQLPQTPGTSHERLLLLSCAALVVCSDVRHVAPCRRRSSPSPQSSCGAVC